MLRPNTSMQQLTNPAINENDSPTWEDMCAKSVLFAPMKLAILVEADIPIAKAVSYTHLDVYKRQC